MDRVSVRLRGLAAVAAVCAFACFGAASASAAPLALASNFSTGLVSVLNTQTQEFVGEPIEVGGRPKSMAITPDARFAYVVNEESGDVSVIDLATRRVVGEPIPVGPQPGEIAISPDGQTAYVADLLTKSLVIISTRTNRVIGKIALTAYAEGIAIAPDGKSIYVAEPNAEAVQVIDARTAAVVGPAIHLNDRPLSIAIAPDGKTIYVGDELAGLAMIDTTSRKVTYLPIESSAGQVTVSPDGETALVSQWLSEAISVVNLRTGAVIKEIQVGQGPGEVALTPDGRFGFVLAGEPDAIWVIDLQKLQAINFLVLDPGRPVSDLMITPDQSPTAAFTVTGITTGFTATFDGSASTDPDGTVAHYAWAFGDISGASEVGASLGGIDLGPTATHTYAGPGAYPTRLTVVDNEGCGAEEVFTGRTAYCSGNPAAQVTYPVEVKGPPASIVPCTSKFAIGGVAHNRRNGTVRVRLKFPSTGSFLLFGNEIHAVTRKVRKPGSTVVTLHARVELNKRLKKSLRAQVRYRVTFTPSAGCGSKTAHRSVALLRAPRKRALN